MRSRIMKKVLSIFLLFSSIFLFVSCDKEESVPIEKEYVIQYTDSLGQHTISVTSGSAYSLESIPEKQGYVFMGLFDSEEGGTQYVNTNGSALSVFTDNKNLILFPQFKPKEYTLILDYQGAVVTGSRSMKVEYDSIIGTLPVNLQLENKEFTGWYTEPNRKGKQIADQYGVLPAINKITEKNFNLDDADGNIYLYAGFKGKEYTVTFYADSNSSQSEEILVEHGTPISEVVPTTRVNGLAVLTWSKTRNDTKKENIFDGKVTQDMILYAAEYAPVIEFDAQGGDEVTPIIARSGDTISLPTPTKENYKFVEWQDANKYIYTSKIMPSESKKLYAKWQAMLIFDTRGGTEVENISEVKGTKITLPTTDKDGYIFAGWYAEDGKLYETTSMPETSVLLTAKYYKVMTEKIVVISASSSGRNWETQPYFGTSHTGIRYSSEINLNGIYSKGIRDIIITAHYKSLHSSSNTTYMAWFSQGNASEAYKVWEYKESHTNDSYTSYERTSDLINLTSDKLYVCYYNSSSAGQGYWTDFWIEVEYPDMSQLY